MMVLMVLGVAFGAPLVVPDVAPIDVVNGAPLLDGKPVMSLTGLYVSEDRYSQYMVDLAERKTLLSEVESLREWKDGMTALFESSSSAQSIACSDGMERLSSHYESALKDASKRTIMEKHGFAVGAALGIVVSSVVAIGTIAGVSRVYSIQIER